MPSPEPHPAAAALQNLGTEQAKLPVAEDQYRSALRNPHLLQYFQRRCQGFGEHGDLVGTPSGTGTRFAAGRQQYSAKQPDLP